MKYLFSIILISLIMLSGWSQNSKTNKTIEVTYVKAYKNFKDSTNSAPKVMKNIEYQLLCNTIEGRFEYIQTMNNDGLKANNRFIGRGGGKGVYYKNLKEQVKLHQTKSASEHIYLIKEKLNRYNWELLSDTKKILDYNCFKAIGILKEYDYLRKKDISIVITVWYTPSLPIPFGPAGYDGLPGLVLESSSSSFYLIAKEVKFHDKNLKIERPTNGKLVSADEFNKSISEVLKKRFKH